MYAIPPAQKRGLALQRCGHIAHWLYVGSHVCFPKHLCGCKGTKKIWIGQILGRESAEKVDFAREIRKNSQLDAASWGVMSWIGRYECKFCNYTLTCKKILQVGYLTAFNTTSGFQSIRMIADSFLPKSLTE